MSQNLGSPPIVTQCHTSTPSIPLNVWRNLWMPPNGNEVEILLFVWWTFKCTKISSLFIGKLFSSYSYFNDICTTKIYFSMWFNMSFTYIEWKTHELGIQSVDFSCYKGCSKVHGGDIFHLTFQSGERAIPGTIAIKLVGPVSSKENSIQQDHCSVRWQRIWNTRVSLLVARVLSNAQLVCLASCSTILISTF